jgi:hypothetical protein
MYVTVGKLGHSGKISSGVANGFAASPSAAGSKTKTNYMQKRPKIVGTCIVNHLAKQAHHSNCPIPLANLARNTGSVKSGFLITAMFFLLILNM